MPRYILCLDTTMGGISLGIYDSQKELVVFDVYEEAERGLAERLIPLLEKNLEVANINYSELHALVVITGPGRFTGLRVGLTAMQSLSLVLNIPLYGISSFQALALSFIKEAEVFQKIAVIIESKRADLFIQTFDRQARVLSKPQCLSVESIRELFNDEECIIIGDGAAHFANSNLQDQCREYQRVDAGAIAKICCNSSFSEDFFSLPAKPLYLRGADVSMPKRKSRRIE